MNIYVAEYTEISQTNTILNRYKFYIEMGDVGFIMSTYLNWIYVNFKTER